MTRQARRRLAVAVAGALAGAATPLWAPRVLRGVPMFQVESVEVRGARFAPEPELRRLAAIGPDATVWDDASEWESRLEVHPLVEDARVRRVGVNRLALEIREVQPVALVATPLLVAVDSDGRALEIDPPRHGLDLPVLTSARLEGQPGRVREEPARRALTALEEIRLLAPEFVLRISEIRTPDPESMELLLVEGSRVDRLVLPLDDAARAFRRATAAVRAAETRAAVVSADARFRDRVVVRTGGRR
ncbi:MAG: FtsQ-type POTRA domain-containing protein [Gemmatimonadota bacterium]